MKKKIMLGLLTGVLAVSMLASCGGQGDGKLNIKLGNFPVKESDPERYQTWMDYVDQYEKRYPDRSITVDTTSFSDMDQTLASAAAGVLPDLYGAPYTNAGLLINSGYARDITKILEERGYTDTVRPELLDMVKDENGNICGIPTSGYMMGVMYNMNLLEQAGLVKEDGTVDYPETFEELSQMAQTITEKTGKPGFGIQTKDRECGWTFMNVAWNYGVKFMEKGEDGKYTATFDSQEMIDALNWIKDLKWNRKAMSDNMMIDRNELIKMFATDQVGIMIAAEDFMPRPTKEYGMDRNAIGSSSMPKGPKGRYSLIGGMVWLLSEDVTDEQAEAIFDWMDLLGYAPVVSQEALTNTENDLKAQAESDNLIPPSSFTVFKDEQRQATIDEIRNKYINVNRKVNLGYSEADDVVLHMEEPEDAQQLYQVVTNMIQEIMLNENVDIPALVKEAQINFQKDSLDK